MSESSFKDIRKQAGLTQHKASELLRVTPRTVRNWERYGAPFIALVALKTLLSDESLRYYDEMINAKV